MGNLTNPKQAGLMSGGRTYPMMPMSPAMVTSIKKAPKGKVPPGLAKWLATHKKGGKNAKA